MLMRTIRWQVGPKQSMAQSQAAPVEVEASSHESVAKLLGSDAAHLLTVFLLGQAAVRDTAAHLPQQLRQKLLLLLLLLLLLWLTPQWKDPC